MSLQAKVQMPRNSGWTCPTWWTIWKRWQSRSLKPHITTWTWLNIRYPSAVHRLAHSTFISWPVSDSLWPCWAPVGFSRGHPVHTPEPGIKLARRRHPHGPKDRLQIQHGRHGCACSAARHPVPGSCWWRRGQGSSNGPTRHLVGSLYCTPKSVKKETLLVGHLLSVSRICSSHLVKHCKCMKSFPHKGIQSSRQYSGQSRACRTDLRMEVSPLFSLLYGHCLGTTFYFNSCN